MRSAGNILLGGIALMASMASAQTEILVGVPAPYTGPNAWFGAETERGAEVAVADLNAAGGVLGQPIRLVKVDDYCQGDQAVAAANKLVADSVDFVMGHECSGAAIPASAVYAEAGILMMTPGASNPLLTEQGLANVFRFRGRDDQQGPMAGNYLADQWSDKRIAIVHDGQAFGRSIAELAKKALNARGVREAMFQEITPGLVDYVDVIQKIQAADIDVLFYGGYAPEVGLLIRQLRDRGDDLQLVSASGIDAEDFGLIGGAATDGTLMTTALDPRYAHQAAEALPSFDSPTFKLQGPAPFQAYGAMQAWAQAVEKAGTLELDAVIDSLRTNEFDTIYGRIGFDDRGDVYGYEPFAWYVWQDGEYAPVDPVELTD